MGLKSLFHQVFSRLVTPSGCSPKTVSQQAISQRFLTFPACLFEKVFKDLLPNLKAAWHTRKGRPIPESVQFTLSRFDKIWIVDCSTLEALFRKLGSLEDVPQGQLAGKMGTVIDLMTRLPVEIWFRDEMSNRTESYAKAETLATQAF